MNILLDTHVLLWWDSSDARLSARAADVIADHRNTVYISSMNMWEIAIKAHLGKLRYSGSPLHLISDNDFSALSFTPEHAVLAGDLEWTHRDPFDRSLVAQAMAENLTLIHADGHIAEFTGVAQLWAS